jgi:predicted esterase
MRARVGLLLLLPGVVLLSARTTGAEPEKGFQLERRVREPTRLDWEFAAGGAKLPARYDSRKQRYQLFVPAIYKPAKTWPLVVFVSPGDDPLGWRVWQKPCEEKDWLFAAAYGAGNSCSPGQRVRAILDILDDVRRHYRIDPDRTYLAGFSGGAEVACRIAFALPEHFAGVLSLSGNVHLPELPYLRRRASERLSVVLLCGSGDHTRVRQEKYLFPLLKDLHIRTRLWIVPGHRDELPPAAALVQAQRWLEDDLARRQKDRADRLGGREDPSRKQLAALALEEARKALGERDELHQGAAQLEWLVKRFGKTESGEKAADLLTTVRADPARAKALTEQATSDERTHLRTRAKLLEAIGQVEEARAAWEGVARLARGEDRNQAAAEAKRLAGLTAKTPWLGASFAGDTTVVKAVLPGGPAHRAGLRAGDRLLRIGKTTVATPGDVRDQVKAVRPGDTLRFALQRGEKEMSLAVTVGSPPVKEE